MRLSFRPPLWAVLATVAGCAVMIWLGVWQWQRGLDKQALRAQYLDASSRPPVVLDARSAAAVGLQAEAATATGHYLADRSLLLDNQIRDRVPGYDVWSPLRLDDGALVIVNRGWVPQNLDRRILPVIETPTEAVRVSGLWRHLPVPGLRLASRDCDPASRSQPWPRVLLYPTIRQLTCVLGEAPLDGELLLSPEAAHGYVREWTVGDNGFPPARHFGYAAQWFAFAATLFGIFIKLNLKRRSP